MPIPYKFANISNRFICLQQNPITLALYLYFFNRSLQLHSGRGRSRIIRTVGKLIQYQLRLPGYIRVLELPFYGNLCLRVHKGHKIFDFKKKIVIKVFGETVNPHYIDSEIEAVRKSSRLNFAPRIRNWNRKDRWYEEDFINGRPCYSNSGSTTAITHSIFKTEIATCLEEMILMQKPVLVEIQDYIGKLIQIIAERKASTALIDKTKMTSINHFIEVVKKSLSFEIVKIPLVFSHGDFSLVNILSTKKGKKVIDWEGAGTRNPLYDLYNFYLTELYYKRSDRNVATRIEESTLTLQSQLKTKVPEIAETFMDLSSIYRRLYYLERICLLFERTLNENVIKVIFRSINLFNRYEKMAR